MSIYLALQAYGPFVWASIGATALALAIELAALRARLRRARGEA